jgi:hypothetical protein
MFPHVSLPKAVDKIVNGWEVSGTVLGDWISVLPLQRLDNSLSGMLGDRADLAVS